MKKMFETFSCNKEMSLLIMSYLHSEHSKKRRGIKNSPTIFLPSVQYPTGLKYHTRYSAQKHFPCWKTGGECRVAENRQEQILCCSHNQGTWLKEKGWDQHSPSVITAGHWTMVANEKCSKTLFYPQWESKILPPLWPWKPNPTSCNKALLRRIWCSMLLLL